MGRGIDVAKSTNLEIHWDKTRGVYVKNLKEFDVTSPEETMSKMRLGAANRAVTATRTAPATTAPTTTREHGWGQAD